MKKENGENHRKDISNIETIGGAAGFFILLYGILSLLYIDSVSIYFMIIVLLAILMNTTIAVLNYHKKRYLITIVFGLVVLVLLVLFVWQWILIL